MAKYHLTAVVWEEEGQFVSQCPELGVASCGRDVADAMKALREAVELYLDNAKRRGILSELPIMRSPARFSSALEVAV